LAEVEIGSGKTGRRAFGLAEVSIVPSRRTRAPEDVTLAWQLDAFRFELPVMSDPDGTYSTPSSVASLGKLGALGVLDLEGVWTRHEDPAPLLEELARLEPGAAAERWRQLHQAPVRPELVVRRVRHLAGEVEVTCGAVSPKRAAELAPTLLEAELDVLVIRGRVVSAEHVSKRSEPLNLKRFIRELDVAVVVGGCTSAQSALHLMRTGAVGVLVGLGGTASAELGVGVPLATAIADVASARSRHLEETGVYVHVIADGPIADSGQLAKAVACGADAVMLGDLLAASDDAAHLGPPPAGSLASRQRTRPLGQILTGPAADSSGTTDLAGSLRKAMATCGYETLREFHKAEVVVV